jgi:hypothetical protein
MIARRDFLKKSIIGGITLTTLPYSLLSCGFKSKAYGDDYKLSLDVPARLFDGKSCWSHPRAGIADRKFRNSPPLVVMTMNILDLSGSDVFRGMYGLHTTDLGKTWSTPEELRSLSPRTEVIDGAERPVAVSDFWPRWHEKTGKLLGTGHTVAYTPEWKVVSPRPRHTSFSVYDPEKKIWSSWEKLEMPDPIKFYNCGAGCTQRYDLPDGTILLPVSFTPPGKNSHVTVLKCSFDGSLMKYLSHGTEIGIDDGTRGIGEPSIAKFDNEYFLTIRNDRMGFVSRSFDGQGFDTPRPWTFDDGSELGSYNTQQHWVVHSRGLFLVYTRRGANNDHVFRHRAPLFMAEVDPVKLHVIRSTEMVLVPERGARLGNFGVTDVSPDETWVTVAEWMQPKGCEKHGSDGSVYAARIHWKTPNRLFRI